MDRPAIERLVRYYETLTPDAVRHLPEYYAADAYFKEVVDPLLDEERAHSAEELAKAQSFAHAFRFICPSEYLPGKQAGAAF